MLQASDKKKVTKSISELKRRVTAADVSTKTGLPVLVVSQALNQIASETGGHLAVSQTGDVVYSFSPGFSNTYLTHGLRQVMERIAQRLFQVLFFLLKISFGIMLILSFFIIVITIFILFFTEKDSNRKRRREPDTKFAFLDYLILHDVLLYFRNPNPRVKYNYNLPTVRRREKANFLLDCFSFLFGDGNPNEGLQEKKWQLVAKVIKQHHSVVTAEQLAPYTGADPKNESAVLPVLVRFDGKPEVTESGNIVYKFPSLAVTTGSDADSEASWEPIPMWLKEFHWKFTEVEASALKPVYFIAFLNFAGSWFLYLLLHSSKAPSITALYTSLVVYGTLFLLVPFVRNLALGVLNKRIDKRNAKRATNAELLANPSDDLKKKIAESRDYRVREKLIGKGSIVYTTEKANLDQEDELVSKFKPGDTFDAKPEETFDASPRDV